MSLQVLAQDMASRGRGPDTMLVHMAPGEVNSLQALARAHGGTLTTNPDTGLPEAGFLSSILPMVAGMALGPAGLGLSALQAGLAAGALGTVATGSLRKGLMAGLGAYGGAGLLGSVTGAGANAASNLASAEATAAGDLAARQALVPSGIPAAPVSPVAPSVPTEYAQFAPTSTNYGAFGEPPIPATPAAPTVGYQAGMAPGVVAPPPPPVAPQPIISSKGELLGYESAPAGTTPAPVEQIAPRAAGTSPTYEQMRAAGLSDAEISQSAREYAADMKGTAQDPFSAATQKAMASPTSTGLRAIADKPELLFNKGNLRYGAAALAPFMLQQPKTANAPRDSEQYRYAYNPGRVAQPTQTANAGEYTYFRPSFTRMADGGMAYANGGPISQLINSGAFDRAAADAAGVPEYTYDPVTQRYLPGVKTATQMPGDIPYAGQRTNGDSGSHSTSPMPQRQSDFFDWMETTEAGRAHKDARGAEIGRSIGMALPGGTIVNSLRGVPNTAPNFGLMFGIPAAFDEYSAQMAQGIGTGLSYNDDYASPSGFGFESGQLGPGATQAEADAIAAAMNDSSPDSSPSSSPSDTSGMDAAGGSGDLMARGGLAALARGGVSHLGDYSDGGRLLKGPGDGVSDSIPATIGRKRPARLADGEFVVPARIVSELGNGSTEAGARKLYAMMDRIQKNRSKTVGKGKVAVNSRSEKLLPA